MWTAHHSNGWDTHVAGTIDRKFAAWAAPRCALGETKYIEKDELSAKAVAVYALEQKTQHTRCSADCSPWEMRMVDSHTLEEAFAECLREDHKRLEQQMIRLEQDHAALRDRPDDLPEHRKHRARVRQHITHLQTHIGQLGSQTK